MVLFTIINLQKIDIPYVSHYTESGQNTDTNKIQMTSGTYQPFYFLPDLTNGVDTLRLKSLTNIQTKFIMHLVIIQILHKR